MVILSEQFYCIFLWFPILNFKPILSTSNSWIESPVSSTSNMLPGSHSYLSVTSMDVKNARTQGRCRAEWWEKRIPFPNLGLMVKWCFMDTITSAAPSPESTSVTLAVVPFPLKESAWSQGSFSLNLIGWVATCCLLRIRIVSYCEFLRNYLYF